jgi:hypothetical protein
MADFFYPIKSMREFCRTFWELFNLEDVFGNLEMWGWVNDQPETIEGLLM